MSDLVNSRVSALKKKRDRCIKNARKYNSITESLNVQALSKTLKRVIKREKRRLARVKSKTSDPKGFWKLVGSYTGRNSSHKINLNIGGESLSDDEAAEAFCDFFNSKVTGLCGDFKDKKVKLVPDSKSIAISLEVLDNAILKTNPKKSTGPDGVPMLVMKDAYPVYRYAYLELFNRILNEGEIPMS